MAIQGTRRVFCSPSVSMRRARLSILGFHARVVCFARLQQHEQDLVGSLCKRQSKQAPLLGCGHTGAMRFGCTSQCTSPPGQATGTQRAV